MGWQVSSTSMACLQAEVHHTFETLVCCSSNKTPLPQKEIKISVCTWIFVQNKDGSYPASAWSRLWGGHSASGAVFPNQGAELSPLPLGRMTSGVTPCPGRCLPHSLDTVSANGTRERNDIMKAAGGKCDAALPAAVAYLHRHPSLNKVASCSFSFPLFLRCHP